MTKFYRVLLSGRRCLPEGGSLKKGDIIHTSPNGFMIKPADSTNQTVLTSMFNVEPLLGGYRSKYEEVRGDELLKLLRSRVDHMVTGKRFGGDTKRETNNKLMLVRFRESLLRDRNNTIDIQTV